jgi:hypothetical protein
VRTLAFVSPGVVLPRVVEQLRADVNPDLINTLSDSDLGIWSTPEGTTFVNGRVVILLIYDRTLSVCYVVLSSKKSDVGPTKGKDAEIARWEADIRNSLASKKATATTTLSKQDQTLLKAQLEKESAVRQRVARVKTNLLRGLQFIRSLVSSGVQDFRLYISTVASLLLDGALRKGSILVGYEAVQTYLVRPIYHHPIRKLLTWSHRSWPNVVPSDWTLFASGSEWRHYEAWQWEQFPRNYRQSPLTVCSITFFQCAILHGFLCTSPHR